MDSCILKVKVNGDSMWPTLIGGDIATFENIEDNFLREGQIVIAKHPFKPGIILIKRISSINENGVFLVGDNPDPTASEDSHNFGRISVADIIGVRQNNEKSTVKC